MSDLMSVRLDLVDTRTAPEDTLHLLHDLWTEMEAEEIPGDPPRPFAEGLAHMRNPHSTRFDRTWLLYGDDEPVGVARVDGSMVDNVENAGLMLFVKPQHRGKGHARRLATAALSSMDDMGRIRFDVGVVEGWPIGALLGNMGLKKATQETRSRLRIDRVDHDLMKSWIEKAEERASDYELLFFDDPVPEDMADAYVELFDVMNTAPRDDLEEEDEQFTVEELREIENRCDLMGLTILSLVARHKETGELAGFTNISYSRHHPPQAWQWGTGVAVDHQNRGIGRWVKAANIELLVEQYPDVQNVDTYNATTNEPMLNINFAMGFQPLIRFDVYQGPVELLREWVGASQS